MNNAMSSHISVSVFYMSSMWVNVNLRTAIKRHVFNGLDYMFKAC